MDVSFVEEAQDQQVYRRRRSLQPGENSRTYNIYTQRVSEVDVSRRALRYSYDDVISNRSITFDGYDCEIRQQCVQLEVVVSNFRPSRSKDVIIDVTVELDLAQVGEYNNFQANVLGPYRNNDDSY